LYSIAQAIDTTVAWQRLLKVHARTDWTSNVYTIHH
jgi:hypothetical protein